MASQGRVRQSLLMLSWALALADQDFASSERQRLHAFANGLKLSQAEVQAAETAAQDYVLDQAMRTAFQFGHDDMPDNTSISWGHELECRRTR